MDIQDLSVQQLAEVRQQLEAELEHLSESFTQLRQAQGKFRDCIDSVKTASRDGEEGKDILVPLTASLYVPGQMKNVDKYVVDVGTDYFVEKNAADAVKLFENKCETLNKNLVDLDKLVNEKMRGLQTVEEFFKKKYAESQKAAATQKAD